MIVKKTINKIKKFSFKTINKIADWTLNNFKSNNIYNKGKVIFIYTILLLILIKIITL